LICLDSDGREPVQRPAGKEAPGSDPHAAVTRQRYLVPADYAPDCANRRQNVERSAVAGIRGDRHDCILDSVASDPSECSQLRPKGIADLRRLALLLNGNSQMDENPYRAPQAEERQERWTGKLLRLVTLLSRVGIAGMLVAVVLALAVDKEHPLVFPLFAVGGTLATLSISVGVFLSRLGRGTNSRGNR